MLQGHLAFAPLGIKEWINENGTTMTELTTGSPGTVRSIEARLTEKYPVEKPNDSDKALLEHLKKTIDLRKVMKMHEQALTITEMAEKLKIPRHEFLRWWNHSLPIINQKIPNRPDGWNN